MNDSVTQLYPQPAQELPLEGLFVGHDLRQFGDSQAEAFVYSNYVVSLDGRIAIPHPTRPGMKVPEAIANPRDWRLFQELAVQADLLITTGRYLRDYADGRAQEILSVYDDPQFADLKDWRGEHGLQPQPDLAVISNSLNFAIPEVLTKGDRAVVVITTQGADSERIAELEAQTGKVLVAGETSVDGNQLVRGLSEMGYRTVYSPSGPKVLHLLLNAGVLQRLYLTHAHRMLGGSPFSSIVEGDLLNPPTDFCLNALYHDPHALEGLGQLFTVYDWQQSA